MNKTSRTRHAPQSFRLENIVKIIVGSVLLAFPVAITEEVWNLGTELSFVNTLGIVAISIFFIAWFIFHTIYNSDLQNHKPDFIIRVMSVYCLTLIVAALILGLFDQFPLLTETHVAIKRMIIVALPASFCATVVDSMR